MKRALVSLSLALSATFCLAMEADLLANVLSADAAHAVAARGAAVVDIRPAADYAAGHLPGAVSAPSLGGAHAVESLQDMVSSLGLDLSREVLIVGQPGDVQAQQLQARLAGYATGRVTWLVGGVHEWALSGRPLETQAAVLLPVPQYLVTLQPEAPAPRMAGANKRDLSAARVLLSSAL